MYRCDLFGGPADGQRFKTAKPLDRILVPVFSDPVCAGCDDALAMPDFSHAEYYLKKDGQYYYRGTG